MSIWIARDADGALYLYRHKPTKLRGAKRFIDKKDPAFFISKLDKDLFPEVTWGNSPKKLKVEE